MAPRHMAYKSGQAKVIRGKVESAEVRVLKNGLTLLTKDLQAEQPIWPFQTNDMGAWLRPIYKALPPEVRLEIVSHENLIHYEVNGGLGAKIGRGSNDNVFTYYLSTPHNHWRIDLLLSTRLYQAIYQEEVKKGLRTPKAKQENPYTSAQRIPWFNPKRNRFVSPQMDPRTKEVIRWLDYEDLAACLREFREDNPDVKVSEDGIRPLEGDPPQDYNEYGEFKTNA